jgi:hypothetical protein
MAGRGTVSCCCCTLLLLLLLGLLLLGLLTACTTGVTPGSLPTHTLCHFTCCAGGGGLNGLCAVVHVLADAVLPKVVPQVPVVLLLLSRCCCCYS